MRVKQPSWGDIGVYAGLNALIVFVLGAAGKWPFEQAVAYFFALMAMTMLWHYIWQIPAFSRTFARMGAFFTRKRRRESAEEVFAKMGGKGKLDPELLKQVADGFVWKEGHPGKHLGDVIQSLATSHRALLEILHHTQDRDGRRLSHTGMEVNVENYTRSIVVSLYLAAILAEKDKTFAKDFKERARMHTGIVELKMKAEGDDPAGRAVQESIEAVVALMDQSSLREDLLDQFGKTLESPVKGIPAMRKYLPEEGLDDEGIIAHPPGTSQKRAKREGRPWEEGEERTFDKPASKDAGGYKRVRERKVRRKKTDIEW